jgi:hypothetical protein
MVPLLLSTDEPLDETARKSGSTLADAAPLAAVTAAVTDVETPLAMMLGRSVGTSRVSG